MRIKDRAWQRLGQLIDALPKETPGGDTRAKGVTPPPMLTPRQQAAQAAGLSRDQVKQAVNIARVPADT